MIKYQDKWLSNTFQIGSRHALAAGYLLALNQALGLYNMATTYGIELTPTELLDDDGTDDKPVPVTIATSAGAVTATQTAKGITISVDESKRTVRPIPGVMLHGGIRPYPAARAIALPGVATIPGYFTPVADDTALNTRTYISPMSLTFVMTGPTTYDITRAHATTKTATNQITARNKDKKNWHQTQYMAMLRISHMSFGKVTEILDFKAAVLQNVKVRIGGFWWQLESLPQHGKKHALKGMHDGSISYVVDWQGAARDLLANELIDKAIGLKQKTFQQITAEGGIHNSMGSVATWYNRTN